MKVFLNNIEQEWHWDNWQLQLDYSNQENIPHLEFQPGTTPHVTNGNTIVLDKNLSLDEWLNKWMIRHEFGHVLGFRDCYIEFYDEDLQSYVNYQLDVSDLMCSRKGKIKENHYLELKRLYVK